MNAREFREHMHQPVVETGERQFAVETTAAGLTTSMPA
jgi:hypothetical protein